MKHIKINTTILLSILVLLGSCSKDFITIQPKGQFLTQNYYTNREQAYSGLVAVYDILRKNAGGFENMITMMNAGSDDNYAGGGSATDGAGIQGFSNYTLNANIMPSSFWGDHYQGIFRANILLDKLPNTSMSDGEKARFIAEAKALRATYYFNLVRMFKNIPLLVEPLAASDIYNVTQATSQAVYEQIEKDLTEAIAVLPSSVNLGTEAGRFTKGAAQAMLGKVYLYDNKKAEA
ncbi:MAG TPA: RagB/SusD family nutrient uptake outer membrane protein, partial [Hanamia sp.]|nr:RagB/SusD family nutrient uptake outer membrane protein [Hanamia sp.]